MRIERSQIVKVLRFMTIPDAFHYQAESLQKRHGKM
jgi:hypothetical protein